MSVFLAGDATQLLRDAVLDSLTASGMSSKARGVGEPELEGKPVELAMPGRLVQLVVESDSVLTY